jgi:hypothetical protein
MPLLANAAKSKNAAAILEIRLTAVIPGSSTKIATNTLPHDMSLHAVLLVETPYFLGIVPLRKSLPYIEMP